MDIILLLASIIFYLYIMRKKKIRAVSLYGIFGLQWFYYWAVPFNAIYRIFDFPSPSNYTNMNHRVIFYFFVFNAVSLLVFSFMFLVFYKQPKKVGAEKMSDKNRGKQYRLPLFFILLMINALLIILGLMFPYKGSEISTMSAAAGNTIHANLRNIFTGLFIFYMCIESNRKRIYLLYFIFIIPTILLGSRIYLAIVTAALGFYLFDNKVVSFKQIVALLLIAITGFSLIGVLRTGTRDLDRISFYFWWPLIWESVCSSYPGFAVTELWLDHKIKYYTYFGSYLIDPVMIFIPNAVFGKEGVEKSSYNILGKWEEDHGGRGKISPFGAYYYIAEALEAAGSFGIVIVSAFFAGACLFVQKWKYSNTLASFSYYNFVGVFGFGFVKNQFSWCSRYFLQNIFALFVFLLVFKVFYEVAKYTRDTARHVINLRKTG